MRKCCCWGWTTKKNWWWEYLGRELIASWLWVMDPLTSKRFFRIIPIICVCNYIFFLQWMSHPSGCVPLTTANTILGRSSSACCLCDLIQLTNNLLYHIIWEWTRLFSLQILWEQEADLRCPHWVSQCQPPGGAAGTSVKQMNEFINECWSIMENEKSQSLGLLGLQIALKNIWDFERHEEHQGGVGVLLYKQRQGRARRT